MAYGSGSTNAQPASAPPVPTRFSSCAAQLEARVQQVGSLMERMARVADRLGGSVPEETASNKIRGNGGNIAAQIEASLEDLELLVRKAERTTERLEAL